MVPQLFIYSAAMSFPCRRCLSLNSWRALRLHLSLPLSSDGGRRWYTNRNIMSLSSRGLISAMFPIDEKQQFIDLCNAKPQTVYAGFDPTADSLHVGNLAVIMLLLHSQRAGHHVIAVIGGATGRIGDPSGRKSERQALDSATVNNNGKKITESIKRIFENHSRYFWDDKRGTEAVSKLLIVDNQEWYKKITALEFVGKVGRHFRVARMLEKDAVKARINSDESGLSFTEFSYQIFQAYDWYHLARHFDCLVQIGGHDQMGNIYAGHDFISRTLKKRTFGLTVPLLTTENGEKYGKSAGNAIWLDDEKTSAFDFYQFFMRSKDADLDKLLKIYTFKCESEIESILAKHKEKPELRIAQKELADAVTTLVHGKEGLRSAIHTTEALYSENIEALSALKVEEVQKIFKATSELFLMPGTTILDMALKARCFANEKDAIRVIEAGGFYLNYRKVANTEEVIVPGIHILPNQISLARVGKKNYFVIKWKSC